MNLNLNATNTMSPKSKFIARLIALLAGGALVATLRRMVGLYLIASGREWVFTELRK